MPDDSGLLGYDAVSLGDSRRFEKDRVDFIFKSDQSMNDRLILKIKVISVLNNLDSVSKGDFLRNVGNQLPSTQRLIVTPEDWNCK
jgi:hypothetical protein